MVSLQVVMRNKIVHSFSQCLFTKEDHSLQTAFLNRAHESFRVCV